jgi:hypothetical protein
MTVARNPNAVEELVGDLTVERHALLEGRNRHAWYRRGLLALVAVIPVLALLNVFGQSASDYTRSGAAGVLHVNAPARVRGGLMYQARFDVTTPTGIKEPQLVLGPGWWEQMTENSINPEPTASSTSNGRVTLSYGRLNAGQKLTVWIQFQVNPAQVGHREANVLLTDGDKPIAQLNRSITVLP